MPPSKAIILRPNNHTASRRKFGGWLALCATLTILFPLLLIHRIALWIDGWLFPTLSNVEIQQPLFIVGLPRSGTTAMHQQVASRRDLFTTMPLWEAVFAPALCEKYVAMLVYRVDQLLSGRSEIGPMEKIASSFCRWLGKAKEHVHPIDFNSPEEDSLALLCYDSCFLRVLTFPLSKRTWDLGYLDARTTPIEKSRLMKRYKGVITRHLRFRGQEHIYLCKTPGYAGWLDALVNEFPDARFIGMTREPKRCIASQLSSIRDELSLFGFSAASPKISQEFVHLFAYFWRKIHLASNDLGEQFKLVQLEDFSLVPAQTAANSLAYLGYADASPASPLAHEVREEKQHISKHQYSLAQFGLDESCIQDAFDLRVESFADEVSNVATRPCPHIGARIREQDAITANNP